MASTTVARKPGKKGQNIRVFVRCRPLNSIEKSSKSISCVDCSSRDVIVKERPLDKFTKTFSFDRVFGPESKQVDVYKAVAKNSVEEVLSGFNCTIFAYGQTGTGKTFTMEGDRTPNNTNWDEDPLAGIIPRCVNHLFDELRLQKLEFTMRVSFLELYNEEIFDLLSPSNDLSKLRLYEDASRKGSCIIQGLEEVLVRSKANVYEILEKGSKKRQTAATLMNAHSSRSHTVFTVTLHIKENTEDGDELLKTGKLHLVDLAGSENISRSGAVDKRAREAGNINQSLLTLGRVITALEEKTPHIPYRESKLTRLLQDALGGRTKTSIIATISPAAINIEETLSTLDYAHRAKNIQNKPEVNQKLNKKELIGEYSQEIERLRLDLMAMREKSGVYLANENYQEMVQTIESQAQEIAEKITHIRSLEEGIENKTNEMNTLNDQLEKLTEDLGKIKVSLKETTEVLTCTQNLLHQTTVDCEEQKHLVAVHVKTEDKLLNQGKSLVEVVDTTTDHVTKLQDKIDRKKNVEKANLEAGMEFRDSYVANLSKLKEEVQRTVSQQKDIISGMSEQCGKGISQCKGEVGKINSILDDNYQVYKSLLQDVRSQYTKQMEDTVSHMKSFTSSTVQESREQKDLLKNFEVNSFLPALQKLETLISAEATVMTRLHSSLSVQLSALDEKLNGFAKQQIELGTAEENKFLGFIDSMCSGAASWQAPFENLSKSVDSRMEDLVNKTSLLIASVTKDIKADFSSAKSSFMSEQSSIEETAEKAKTEIKLSSANYKESCTVLSSEVASLASDVRSNVEDFSAESEDNVRHLGEQRCELASFTSRFICQTNSYLEELSKDTEAYGSKVEVTQEEHVKANSEAVEKVNTSLESDKEKLMQVLEEELGGLEKELSSIKENCANLAKSIETQAAFHEEELDVQKQQIIELFSEKMVQDLPTGQTPVRQEYKFSRMLPMTSPHDVILRRYRATSLNSVSRIPLPFDGGDTEDDISSPSFDASRFSSSDSSHLEEDIMEVKSLSGSVSDIRSNPGSTTDLRMSSSSSKSNKEVFAVPSVPVSRENSMVSLSRSSSTSSIPESKDKENTSNQRGSTKKRGLRPPTAFSISTAEKTHGQESNTRSRRVLGMQN